MVVGGFGFGECCLWVCIDVVFDGLWIWVVGGWGWFVFGGGGVLVKFYMCDILCEIGVVLGGVENCISLVGYIDVVFCGGGGWGYSNWELLVGWVNVLYLS